MNNRRLIIRTSVSIILLLLVLIFAVQNAALVDIRYFRWQFELPRSALIFTMLAIGFIVGWSSRAIYRVVKGQRDSRGGH